MQGPVSHTITLSYVVMLGQSCKPHSGQLSVAGGGGVGCDACVFKDVFDDLVGLYLKLCFSLRHKYICEPTEYLNRLFCQRILSERRSTVSFHVKQS